MDTQGDETPPVAVVGGAGGVGGGTPHGPNNATRKRFAFARVVPEQGKKRVNYGKGDARRIMEEAVSLCEAMTLGYEVVFHGRRRSFAGKSGSISDGVRYTYTRKTLNPTNFESMEYLRAAAESADLRRLVPGTNQSSCRELYFCFLFVLSSSHHTAHGPSQRPSLFPQAARAKASNNATPGAPKEPLTASTPP
ncbi:unnamed protein product, partial [Laminaria digitata]